jgi:transposase
VLYRQKRILRLGRLPALLSFPEYQFNDAFARLERCRFLWPSPADGVVTITPAQLGYLLEALTGGCRNIRGDRRRLADRWLNR